MDDAGRLILAARAGVTALGKAEQFEQAAAARSAAEQIREQALPQRVRRHFHQLVGNAAERIQAGVAEGIPGIHSVADVLAELREQAPVNLLPDVG